MQSYLYDFFSSDSVTNNGFTNSIKRFIISKVLPKPLNKNEEEGKFLKKNKKIKILMCKQYMQTFILEN